MSSYTNIPKDLNKIKSKAALNMTIRQLICFGTAAITGIPTYLLTRGAIGNTAAVLIMMVIMSPLFLLAMYEKDGLPAEKLVRNYIRTRLFWPGIRPFKVSNFYENITQDDEVMKFEQNCKKPAKTAEHKHSNGKGQPCRTPERKQNR